MFRMHDQSPNLSNMTHSLGSHRTNELFPNDSLQYDRLCQFVLQ